jgi:hypothetical protein
VTASNNGLQADGGTAAVWHSVAQAHVRGGFAPAAEPWPFVRQAKLGVFLQGASPCGVRSHQPLLPSVAAVKEGEDRRTTQPKRTQGPTETARETARRQA